MALSMLKRVATLTVVLLFCVATMAPSFKAQAPAPPPKKAAPPSRVSTRPADRKLTAPQVVTIVHRLNGLKMFRLLMRADQQAQAIASLDSAFNLLDDVHTNVIAGLAMDDGETIAAWLPEADVEFGAFGLTDPNIQVPDIPTTDMAPPAAAAPMPASPPSRPKTKAALRAARSMAGFGTGFFESPDVTVIGPDGKPLAAKYIGLDAVTGLSILRLADKNPPAASAINVEPGDVGESVRLFSPEPVTGQRGLLSTSGLYVRIGTTEGKIFDVRRGPSGGVARFKVSSPRLSQAMIGGVAVNEAGETLGIVDGLQGSEASVLPVELIRRAARRVLERQASVPKPWLGVSGEAVAALKVDQFVNHGWKLDRAAELAGEHRGILLTSIVPGSPAANAALRVGDVILKVNNQEIANGEDFTWLLEQAGPSSSVSFTVARPDRVAEESFNVKLSGMLDPRFTFKFKNRFFGGNTFGLMEHGIETIALRPPVASQLGTTAGLLVVYVEPSTAAFEAGLQPGDVIQSIDGKPVNPLRRPFLPPKQTTFTFEIVRNKEKRVITVNPPKEQ
jgi:S1-C subfamily serine protease